MGQGAPKEKQPDLTDMCIELRMASKQINKEASRAQAKEAQEKKKVADLLAKGKKEIAQIHAESAIRERKQAINLTRLAAQMEAVESQLRGAERMTMVSATMERCMPGLKAALGHMESIGISQSMETFNKLFEDMGVKSASISDSLDQATGTSVDTREVDKLLDQVSEENGLKLAGEMGAAGTGKLGVQTQAKNDVNEYEARLNALKQ